MNKRAIAEAIEKNHSDFLSKIASLSDEDFLKKPGTKWSAGQQLEHIIKSVKPVDMAYGLPFFVLKMKFGLANRPSKTYDALVEKYLRVLEENKDYELPKTFAPDGIKLKHKQKNIDRLEHLVKKLIGRLDRFSEEELDTYILPHPIMGKLTLREMLYFTMYHVTHHDRQVLENLNTY